MGGIGFSLSFCRRAVVFALPSVIFIGGLVAGQPAQRIKGEIYDGERFALTGNVRPSLVYAQDQGPVSGSLALSQMTMHFAMSASQKADLLQLLRLQQTRHSSQYHKWLTPEEYADRFGMNAKDLEKVQSWLEMQGFSNIQAARSRTFITFSGTAARAQSAFNTSIHSYLVNGVSHYANAVEPQLPKALNGVVESIRGLHDFRQKPHMRARLTSNVTGNHFLVPDDWATIYDVKLLYNNGIDGTGHSIAIVGQTDLNLPDIETFQTNAGLPVKDPTVILTGSVDPGIQVISGDLGESDLDIEWAGGIAKGATIIFVTNTDVLNAESYAVDNNVADVLSISYGECEADAGAATMRSLNTLFQQASAQGMSVVAVSGDQGAADCDSATASVSTQGLSVDVPASSPWVTAVGGTEFNEGTATGATSYWSGTNNASNGSATSYIPETAWNDSATDGVLSASGGGASTLNSKPSWQTGTGVPADGARDVPDLAFAASADHDGYITCSVTQASATAPLVPTCVVGFRASAGGNFNVAGGTSAAGPSFAALAALLDQKLGARQGNLNQNIYTLASITSTTSAFHDITSGNNIVACKGGLTGCSSTTAAANGTFGYSAGVGYDQVTGWGSVDAYNFVSQWDDDFVLKPAVTSLSVAAGSATTATIAVSAFGSFTGTVTFACSVSGITGATCSIPGTVSHGSGSVTLTVTTSASSNTPWWRKTPTFPNYDGFMLALVGMTLAAGVYLAAKQRKMQMAGLAFTVLLVIGLSGCGSSSSSSTSVTSTPTPATTSGTVTVSATSGSLVNSITLPITVTH